MAYALPMKKYDTLIWLIHTKVSIFYENTERVKAPLKV